MTISIALVWAVSVFLWLGDLDRADQHINRLFTLAELHSLGPYLAVGRGFRGEIAIRRGDPEKGVRSLQHCLTELHAAPYELLTTPLNIALVQGLVATRRFVEALALLDETIRSVEAKGDLCYMPELLRVKGNLILATPHPRVDEAEAYFSRSLDLSQHQGALAWELRSAIDMAALPGGSGMLSRARGTLQSVYGRFGEGLNTVDLKSAADLLARRR